MSKDLVPDIHIPFFQRSSTRFYLFGAAAFFVLTIIILLTTVFFRSGLIDLRKQELKRLVMLGINTISPAIKDYTDGEISREEAMEKIVSTVRRMTYVDETMENYLFMSGYDGEMLVQPFEPEKEGDNQWDLQDSKGKYIIRELVETAKKGSGYVSYYYPPPGSDIPQLKISYVVGITPLSCYIGTGMYIGDLESVIRSTLVPMTILIAAVLFVFIAVFLLLTRPFISVYRYLVEQFAAVQADPEKRLFLINEKQFRNSEAEYLIVNFRAMISKIADNRKEIVRERSKLKLLLENLPAFAFLKDTGFRYVTANRLFCDWVGHSPDELRGKTDFDLFSPERAEKLRREDEKVFAGLQLYQVEEESRKSDGTVYCVDKRKLPILDDEGNPIGIIGLAFDITESKKNERELIASLKEKEMLLKEVHHRVKNNLQIISSLLNLQLMTIEDESYRALLRESSNRISSMATIHEMLYKSIEVDTVEVGDYVKEVTRYLWEVFGVNSNRVRMNQEVSNFDIDLDKAIPLGLIITELVSNSLKYAFNGHKTGTITLSLGEKKEMIELVVQDNGIGLPESAMSGEVDSLGLLLVNTLASQLQGKITMENRDGAYISIVFPR